MSEVSFSLFVDERAGNSHNNHGIYRVAKYWHYRRNGETSQLYRLPPDILMEHKASLGLVSRAGERVTVEHWVERGC